MQLSTIVKNLSEKYSPSVKHYFNPLHIYCRLIDLSIDKKYAKRIGVLYENHIYKKLRR